MILATEATWRFSSYPPQLAAPKDVAVHLEVGTIVSYSLMIVMINSMLWPSLSNESASLEVITPFSTKDASLRLA